MYVQKPDDKSSRKQVTELPCRFFSEEIHTDPIEQHPEYIRAKKRLIEKAVKCKAVQNPIPGAYFDLICEKHHETCPHRVSDTPTRSL